MHGGFTRPVVFETDGQGYLPLRVDAATRNPQSALLSSVLVEEPLQSVLDDHIGKLAKEERFPDE
jgi:hypothetical protein